jgi:hypothetical protein
VLGINSWLQADKFTRSLQWSLLKSCLQQAFTPVNAAAGAQPPAPGPGAYAGGIQRPPGLQAQRAFSGGLPPGPSPPMQRAFSGGPAPPPGGLPRPAGVGVRPGVPQQPPSGGGTPGGGPQFRPMGFGPPRPGGSVSQPQRGQFLERILHSFDATRQADGIMPGF